MMERPHKVLLIDDDEVMHDLTHSFLSKSGYNCVFASNGMEGLDAMTRESPDVVLLDYMMPDMDGEDVYRKLISDPKYASARSIPVIVLTGKEDDRTLKTRLLELGVNAYLPKPFGFRELVSVIDNVFITHSIHQKNLQLRREIGETRDHLALVVENSPIGIFTTDPGGRVVQANPQCARIMGDVLLAGRDVFGDPVLAKLGAEDCFRRVLHRGERIERKGFSFVDDTGRAVRANLWCEPLTAYDHQRKGMLALIEDVTDEEHRAYELSVLYQISRSIQATQDLDIILHVILTSITAGCALGFSRAAVFLIDEASEMVEGRMGVGPSSHEEAARIWTDLGREELPLAEFLGKYGRRLPPTDSPLNALVRSIRIPLSSHDNAVVRTIEDREPLLVIDEELFDWHDDAVVKKLGASEFVVVPIVAKDRILGTIFADNMYSQRSVDEEIIELLRSVGQHAGMAILNADAFAQLEDNNRKLADAYRELKTTQNRLVHSERLAAVGEMAAHVAHEIRNPLVTIGGYARSVLKLDGDLDPRVCERARIIVEETERLENILRNVLDFLRVSMPTPRETDVNQLVSDMACHLDSEIGDKDIDLHVNLARDLPATYVDSDQIKQALYNVTKNAVHSMADGGNLVIQTRFDRAQDLLCIEIKDSGQGMTPDVQENIFNPFFTTRQDGTGLGLAITNKIVHDHGGEIKVKSRPGVGTVVSIWFPRAYLVHAEGSS